MKSNFVSFAYLVINLFLVPWSGVLSDERLSYVDLLLGKQTNVEDKSIISDLILNSILNIYAPVSDAFDNDLCRNHSQVYKEAVKNNEVWAIKMFDSSAKFPKGLLAGHIYEMGNYDECVELEDLTSEFGSFSGQYCLVSLGLADQQTDFLDFNGEDPIQLQRDILALRQTNRSTRVSPNIAVLTGNTRWAICIPSSCRANDLQLHFNDAFGLPLNGATSFKVNDLTCSSRANPVKFTAADWFAVVFFSFFGLLVVLSTAYDLLNTNSESRHSLLLAFSLYTNGRKLLSVGPASSDSLSALHGIRFFSMLWVVLGHRYMYSASTPVINTFKLVDYFSDWKHIIIINAYLSVDSFFLLSGILVCYIFLKEMEKGSRFNVPLYYLHRYVRLTPAFAVIMLLTATLATHMGDGPFWNKYAESDRQRCEQSWWAGMIYLNNYIYFDTQCVEQSWYLAVDMQLFWLSPLLLIPLWRWPKFGKILGYLLLAAGLIVAFLVPYINEFPVSFRKGSAEERRMQYFPTHTRYTPWLLGIGLGYLLHHTKHTTLHLSAATVVAGWLLSAGLLLTSLLLSHRFQQPGHEYERVFESLYYCLMRPGWALGLAWVIFACVKGYGGFVNTFLSWEVFQVLGRLTYTVYLTHCLVQKWVRASVRTPGYFSDTIVVTEFFSDVIMSFAAAFVLSLTFESPAMIIEKHLLGNLSHKGTKTKSQDVESRLKESNTDKAVQLQSMTAVDLASETENHPGDLSDTTDNTARDSSSKTGNTAGELSETSGNTASDPSRADINTADSTATTGNTAGGPSETSGNTASDQ